MNLFPFPNLVNRRFLLALLASSFVPFSSVKAFTTYENEAEFLASFADSSEYTTETFSDLADGEHLSFSMEFTNFTMSTPDDDPNNGFWKSVEAGGPWLGTLAQNQPLTISFGTGVRAVGMFFTLTDSIDAPQDGDILIRFNNDGDWLTIRSSSTGSAPYFAAKATDTLITTLEIKTEESEPRWVAVAATTVAPVPEPSTYLLFGAGAVAYLALKRRRQASRG